MLTNYLLISEDCADLNRSIDNLINNVPNSVSSNVLDNGPTKMTITLSNEYTNESNDVQMNKISSFNELITSENRLRISSVDATPINVIKLNLDYLNEDLKKEERRSSACSRERLRMQEINHAFNKLRIKLPSQSSSRKRLSKIESLRCAINYIKQLRSILINTTMESRFETPI